MYIAYTRMNVNLPSSTFIERPLFLSRILSLSLFGFCIDCPLSEKIVVASSIRRRFLLNTNHNPCAELRLYTDLSLNTNAQAGMNTHTHTQELPHQNHSWFSPPFAHLDSRLSTYIHIFGRSAHNRNSEKRRTGERAYAWLFRAKHNTGGRSRTHVRLVASSLPSRARIAQQRRVFAVAADDARFQLFSCFRSVL